MALVVIKEACNLSKLDGLLLEGKCIRKQQGLHVCCCPCRHAAVAVKITDIEMLKGE